MYNNNNNNTNSFIEVCEKKQKIKINLHENEM